MAEKVAGADVTVLLTDETGTGKEVFSRTIHQKSKRHEKPYSGREREIPTQAQNNQANRIDRIYLEGDSYTGRKIRNPNRSGVP